MLCLSGYAQNIYVPLNNESRYQYDRIIYQKKNSHTAIKPYMLRIDKDKFQKDSALIIKKDTKGLGYLLNENLIEFKRNKSIISINPILNCFENPDVQNKVNLYYYSGGMSVGAIFNDKLSSRFRFFYSLSSFPDYISKKIDSTHIVPQYGSITDNKNNSYFFQSFCGDISYSPSEYFNFQVGKDKNFLGDGYRSLLLSDNSNSYPFFKATVDIWKIKYIVLYSILKDQNSDYNFKKLFRKYSTSHFLSWNLSSRINLNLFETVIWRDADSSGSRGFDVNYMNPIIFFRPVEFSLGSPDNVIMGGGFRVRFFNNSHFYNQFVLDEFKLLEIKAKNGWWGNKYGFQFGIKSFDIFKIEGLYLQTEYNFVRPFTYSHRNSMENYGNNMQALAHPLGANFAEAIIYLRYQKNRFYSSAKLIATEYGINKDSINVGQNIYLSYLSDVNEYGNSLLQGNKTRVVFIEAKTGWIINPEWNLVAELGIQNRNFLNDISNKNYIFVIFGLKTNLDNIYNEF
ncbi:MAG: hypothetical protein ABIJ97_04525 [Bacteroidota bacterium]